MYKLRDSQQVALERLCEPGRHFGALWAEPRSGKTAVALKWLENTGVKLAVIIAPKVAEAIWKTEADKWLTIPHRYFSLTGGKDYPSDVLFIENGVNLFFVNYEQFGKNPFKRLKPFLKHLSSLVNGYGVMILDESHMIKTPAAITGRNIRPLANQWYWRLIMTGTPVTNPSQIDAIYGQWVFLDPSIRKKWASAREFREHFGEWNTMKGFPELIRPRNQYELNKYIQPNVITMTGAKSKLVTRLIGYNLPDAVMRNYKVLEKDAITNISGHTVAALNPLTRLLRLRQIVAGWCTDDENNKFIVKESAKKRLSVLKRILDRTKGKAIITCTHLYEIKLVESLLCKSGMKYLVINGSVADKNRVIEKFQNLSSIKVLLVQPRTISMAVDISVASDLIWYSSDFNYVTYKQTSDRIKLSPANPTVWFICAKGTVDEDVWITLTKDHKHLAKVVRRVKSGNKVCAL